jgi:Pyruvate/2-oxoacid:ferredoxin oxidoreductase delta subunit
LLSSIYTEEEAKVLVSSFKKSGESLSLRKISKLTGEPREKLKDILEGMNYKGKLMKMGPLYMLLPYLPGGFEVYFTVNRDDPERMKKAAKAHQELRDIGFSFELSASKYPVYRVIPAIEPLEKLIELGENTNIEHKILPYEVLRDYLSKAIPKKYAVVPCSCRNAAKLAGNPCKRTNDNFCVATGILAQNVIETGVGKEASLDELISIMEKAEKEGLVHETFNMQDTAIFVCNCCSCCCGFLKSVKELKNYGSIVKSNFDPIIDKEQCNLCEICVENCPMKAIYHHWPHKEDLSDDMIVVRPELCIGCGVCASNCPLDAITLEKVRDFMPLKGQTDLLAKRAEEKAH